MMFGTGGKLAIAQGPQFPAQGLFGDNDPKLLEQPLAEIDDTPPNHAVDGGNRAALDNGGKRFSMRFVEP
jgi:hypothetical protein